MGLLSYLIPQKPPKDLKTTVFTCKRDDLTISGTEYLPLDLKEGDRLPIAIVSHGFMANQETTKKYAQHLARLGYAAYCYDFNGGSALKNLSSGKTTDMSVLTEVKDLEAVIAYTASLPYTDEAHLLLMGCSQGGFVSALTAAKHPELAEKLVLFYPALCIPDDARAGKMMAAKFDPKNIPEQLKCGPMKLGRCYVADVIDIDPYEAIAPYPGKVMLIHGTNDKIVNVSYAHNANKAYLASTPEGMDPKDRISFTIIEKAKHGFNKKHDAIALAALSEFVKK